jgi:hypothetical protein
VAYRIRNNRGSWVGEKRVKVASPAIASVTIDLMLGTDSKKHPIAHSATLKVEGFIIERIISGTIGL